MRCLRSLLLIGICAPITVTSVAAQSTLPVLLGQLGSSDWRQRSDAVTKIIKLPGALNDSQVRSALLTVLDTENQLIRSTLRESDGKIGVSSKYGEGWSDEYYSSDLSDAILTFADLDDPHTLRILAQCAYNPDSGFARLLAPHADKFLPTLLDDVDSDVSLIRSSALGYIGAILHKFKPAALKAEDADRLMQVLRKKTMLDADVNVRSQAMIVLRDLADVNGDGKVDCADLSIVTASLGKKAGEAGFDPRADTTLRRAVDQADLAYVTQYLPVGMRCQP